MWGHGPQLIRLLSGFQDHSSFVWSMDIYLLAWGNRSFPESTKTAVVHKTSLQLFCWFKLSYSIDSKTLSTHISIICLKKKSDNLDNSFSSYFNIVINHSRRQKHMIYWTNKNKAISQQFDTAQKTDELLIIWYLVRPF